MQRGIVDNFQGKDIQGKFERIARHRDILNKIPITKNKLYRMSVMLTSLQNILEYSKIRELNSIDKYSLCIEDIYKLEEYVIKESDRILNKMQNIQDGI
jgi:hypothetical protein